MSGRSQAIPPASPSWAYYGDTEGQEEHGHGEEEDEGHAHGALDPHFWFDPLRVKQAVNSIAAQLSTVDPAGQGFYRDNAAAYNRELDNLHRGSGSRSLPYPKTAGCW